MITVMTDAPANIVAFHATGDVTKEDYDTIVIPAIEKHLQEAGSINFLLWVDTKMKNFSAGALLKDMGIGLKHFSKWHKMAIVSDEAMVVKFTDIFSYIAPGEAKGFEPAQLEEAKQWASN